MIRASVFPAVLAVCLVGVSVRARVLSVPDSFPTIQAGIDASAHGDTVLVAVNRYYENIDFRGHNIVVASQFIIDSNLVWVAKTVIDGSQPADPDTASCVRIVSGEDSTAQLVGFTITGGAGTKWTDEHGAGLFREGGGILIQGSSPVIRNNRIEDNAATNRTGCVSAGGGAIRVGDGNPRIVSSIVCNNVGRYGAGIVLNYSGATILNNLIAYNSGGEDYGGGGVWAYSDGPAPKSIENCAVAGNLSATLGGGMRFWSTGGLVRNCVVWGNSAPSGAQIYPTTVSPAVAYSDVQGGREGTGNIDADPNWSPDNLMLHSPSPCIDSGDPDPAYYDPDSAGAARWPALGTLRNDMGAYGGPLAQNLGASMSGTAEDCPRNARPEFGLECVPQPFRRTATIRFTVPASRYVNLAVYDALGRRVKTVVDGPLPAGCHSVALDARGLGAGIYACRLLVGERYATKVIVVTD